MKISQKIIDYALWYYLTFYPSKKQFFDKLKLKFGPESEKGKKYGGISDEEIEYIIDEKMKSFLQEEEILRAKINSFLRKGKNLSYIKTKLFEKKFDKNDIEEILNKEFLDSGESLLNLTVLEKNILALKNKGKSKKFIQQKFCERKEDFEIVNEILEKVFYSDGDSEEDFELENLKKEYDKISNKIIKGEKISQQKIIEKLLGKGFSWDDVKKILL